MRGYPRASDQASSYPVSNSHAPLAIAWSFLKKGNSVITLTTVADSLSIILALPNPLNTFIYWSTWSAVKTEAEAVIVTVPSMASGVIVPDGLLVAKVKATLGSVKDNVENVQVVLLAPLTIDLGDISSWTKINVSAFWVKYIRSKSISPNAHTK